MNSTSAEHPDPDAETGDDKATAEVVGEALSAAARKAGIDPDSDATTGAMVWAVMGRWRGVMESVLPLLAFIVCYTVTKQLVLSLGISVGIAAVFTLVRLAKKSPPMTALSGLFAAIVAAIIPLLTGRAEDQFIVGFITNAAYGSGIALSAIIGWPLIGLIVGYLKGEGLAWRHNKRRKRAFIGLTLAWAGLFFMRLAVQLPFYFSGDVALLGTVKLIMGLPLFGVLLAATWWVSHSLYRASGTPSAKES
ncbi:DUF3159 domain-containing protein [Microbacterium sp. YY-01]|uniref:DUF3159 domain-containing protein n=1 Tax=Microbacterium sp. YY-01 TaxID=3421634 RepID=UPI003D186A48